METANKKPWLSPHGQTLEIAQWVVENKAPLLDTDEYRNHTTMRMWVEESQKILDSLYMTKSEAPLHFRDFFKEYAWECEKHGKLDLSQIVSFNLDHPLLGDQTRNYCLLCLEEVLVFLGGVTSLKRKNSLPCADQQNKNVN